MMRRPIFDLLLFILLPSIAWMGNAQAKTCNIDGGGVAFGMYDPTSSSHLDTTGTLRLKCNEQTDATLSLSVGNGAGASYAGGRKMTSAVGGTLKYNLYTDVTRTRVLGDGTNGSITLKIVRHNSQNLAIWARIPGGQGAVQAGAYGDTVIATVSY